jgi:hypothetical protein
MSLFTRDEAGRKGRRSTQPGLHLSTAKVLCVMCRKASLLPGFDAFPPNFEMFGILNSKLSTPSLFVR